LLIKSADDLAEIQPTLAEALELRGDIRQQRGEADLALADYAAALAGQPKRVSALMKRGSLLQARGKTEDAARAYLAALDVNRDLAPAYNNLAWMAAESKEKLEQAEQWATRAVALGPKVAEYHDTLGWVLRARGRLRDAEQALKQATALNPTSAASFYHLGVVQQELNRPKEAARSFAKTLEIDPTHETAKRALEQLGNR
jgi:tetratricopeptide (TPR) repeat protein